MTVSIIIAVKEWQSNLEECVAKCRKLDFPDFEIIILPDVSPQRAFEDSRIRIIPTGGINPARKRDLAIDKAKGDILAFIDDDAYPSAEWLKAAVNNFADPQVAAVGGPAITPETDSLRQKASGLVYSSRLVSAGFVYRYRQEKRRTVEDFPSCNLLVRRSVMQELGGFKTDYWPGEDTKLCLDITRTLKKRIIYDPLAIVFHHRRPLFLAHIKQVASYALHRGYFVRKFPQTSRKLSFFVPSLFLISLYSLGIAAFYFPGLKPAFFASVFSYLAVALIVSIQRELRLIPLVFSGIIITHFAYGVYFLKGLTMPRLKEEL